MGVPSVEQMTGQMAAPTLRPQAGFCMKCRIQGAVDKSSMTGSKLYINFTSHPLVERPKNPNGKAVEKDWILKYGIGNMQVLINCSVTFF